MTVDEYGAEFDRLSRFAPTLIVDDESKMKRFEKGLKPHIRRGFTIIHSANYDDLIDRVKNIEIIWKETQNIKEEKSKKRARDFEACALQNEMSFKESIKFL